MTILALCSWLSGCSPIAEGQSDEQLNAHYLAGKEKLGAFDYKGALESFERALEDQPRSPLTHFELGVLYEQQEHDYAAALYHYNRVIRLRPGGNPAEIARQRIPGCRQELVKADSLATINPAMLGEIQSLRTTNQWLMRELEVARAQLTGRGHFAVPTNSPPAPSSGARTGSGGAVVPGSSTPRATSISSARDSSSGSRGRTHTVKPGDTLASIARQYGLRLDALLAANPGLNPRKLKIGQAVAVPGS